MKYPNENVKTKVENAPLQPGCYIYRDKNGTVIYIGKAINLRNRLKSYFSEDPDHVERISQMVNIIYDVEFVVADSDMEAFLLETNLIHKYHPKYNVDKQDDKNYGWIKITIDEDFPRIYFVRKKDDPKAKYFGPYPSGVPARRVLRLLRKIFPYRTCNRTITQNEDGTVKSSDPKPCLYYFLGLCKAPCAGFIDKKVYRADINKIIKFFERKHEEVIKELQEEMLISAKEQNYEDAAIIRNKLNDLAYLSQKAEIETDTDERRFVHIKSMGKALALDELIKFIGDDRLELKQNFKMECYDISNTQGKLAVGSMTVFVDGAPANRLYRKFRIKMENEPNDFAMLQEVFRRRFKKHKPDEKKKPDASFSVLPDLIIVDGGRGQLSSTYKILAELEIDIPIVGLAKRNEDVILIEDNNGELSFKERNLKPGSQSRFLMQRIRDETHRFGITYHRLLRGKSQQTSALDGIDGIGEVLRNKLLRAFGSVDGIKKASETELGEVVKNKSTVKKIKSKL